MTAQLSSTGYNVIRSRTKVHETDFGTRGWLNLTAAADVAVPLDDYLQPRGPVYVDQVTIRLDDNAQETSQTLTIPRDQLAAVAAFLAVLDHYLPSAPPHPDAAPVHETADEAQASEDEVQHARS